MWDIYSSKRILGAVKTTVAVAGGKDSQFRQAVLLRVTTLHHTISKTRKHHCYQKPQLLLAQFSAHRPCGVNASAAPMCTTSQGLLKSLCLALVALTSPEEGSLKVIVYPPQKQGEPGMKEGHVGIPQEKEAVATAQIGARQGSDPLRIPQSPQTVTDSECTVKCLPRRTTG